MRVEVCHEERRSRSDDPLRPSWPIAPLFVWSGVVKELLESHGWANPYLCSTSHAAGSPSGWGVRFQSPASPHPHPSPRLVARVPPRRGNGVIGARPEDHRRQPSLRVLLPRRAHKRTLGWGGAWMRSAMSDELSWAPQLPQVMVALGHVVPERAWHVS